MESDTVSKQDLVARRDALKDKIETAKKWKKSSADLREQLNRIQKLIDSKNDREEVTVDHFNAGQKVVAETKERKRKPKNEAASNGSKRKKTKAVGLFSDIDFSNDDEYRQALKELRNRCSEIIEEHVEFTTIRQEESITSAMAVAAFLLSGVPIVLPFSKTIPESKYDDEAKKEEQKREDEELSQKIEIVSKAIAQKLLPDPNTVIVDLVDPTSRWHPLSVKAPIRLDLSFERRFAVASIMGMWEGYKVFENKPEPDIFTINAKNPKKRVANEETGPLLGWRKGAAKKVINVRQAKKTMLAPAYLKMIETDAAPELQALKKLVGEGKKLILVDDNTKFHMGDDSAAINAACMLRLYLLDKYPVKKEVASVDV